MLGLVLSIFTSQVTFNSAYATVHPDAHTARERAFATVRLLALDPFAKVTIHSNELIYLGNGVFAYPRDIQYTTITPNWTRIAQEAQRQVIQSEPLQGFVPNAGR